MKCTVVIVFGFVLSGCANSRTDTPENAPSVSAHAEPVADDLAALNNEQLGRRLLEDTGGTKVAESVVKAVIEDLTKSQGLDPQKRERLMKDARPDDLVARLVPLYASHLDRDTMIATIRFYESASGRRFSAALPTISNEAVAIGQSWGRGVAARITLELHDAGHD